MQLHQKENDSLLLELNFYNFSYLSTAHTLITLARQGESKQERERERERVLVSHSVCVSAVEQTASA